MSESDRGRPQHPLDGGGPPDRRHDADGRHPMPDHPHGVPQLFVLITDADQRKAIARRLTDLHLRVFQCRATGTASNETLDMLGLADTDKVITLCVTAKLFVGRMLHVLRKDLRLDRAGGGIAFTVPCSSIANPLLRLLEQEARDQLLEHIESEVNLVKETATHDLIVAVINQGYCEELMERAKQEGATGGTVIHASQMVDTEKAQRWGITVHDEKEIVVMLVPREQKLPIMRAIGKSCGITTQARGLIFALPVDEVEGLGTPL